jgi:RNA-directed DNA polymerase
VRYYLSKLESLRNCENLNDLAQLLGFQPKKMAYILYGIKDEHKYNEFSIPKKDGGKRKITAPNEGLKTIQKRLSNYLYNYLEELKPEQNQKSRPKRKKTVSHGYKKGLSIATNADAHKNKKYVFNLDLEDFFSIY